MENKQLYTRMINSCISTSGLEVPTDLIPWGYRWKCYIYSNILPAVFGGDRTLSRLEETVELVSYLLGKLQYEHSCNWVREKLYPIDPKVKKLSIPLYLTYPQLIIYLYFNKSIDIKNFVVDDYMLRHAPQLKKYVLGDIDMPEEKEEKKTYAPKYKLTPKFDFWEPDHYTEFKRLSDTYGGKDNLKFLEIGAFEGRTSVWLLDNVLTGKGSTLTCVDVNPPENLKHNLSYHKDKARLVKTFSHEWFYEELVDGGGIYDFAYIDGDHNASGVIEDAVLAWRALKIGGSMYFDDYEMEIRDPWFYVMHKEFKDNPRLSFIHPHVAIDAFLNIYRGQYEILFKNYLVGIKKLVDFGGENVDHGDDTQPKLELEE